jgi:hypothetical protein
MTAIYSLSSFRRRPESSGFIQQAFGFVPVLRGIFPIWIPACAGMTGFVQ